MMPIRIKTRGNLKHIEAFISNAKAFDIQDILERFGQDGVEALRNSTPKETGATADAWRYEIVQRKNGVSIFWSNDNAPYGVPVAVLIQYGHGTRGGGFVEGIDYINPALKPVFDKIADEAWKKISKNS